MNFFQYVGTYRKDGCKAQYRNIVPTKYTADNGQCPIQHRYRKTTNVTKLYRT